MGTADMWRVVFVISMRSTVGLHAFVAIEAEEMTNRNVQDYKDPGGN